MAATSKLGQELIALYVPFDNAHWENKLFISDLMTRMIELEQTFPPAAKPTKDFTSAVFDNLCDIKAYVEEVSSRLGIDTKATVTVEGETFDVYDFSCQSYDDFEATVAAILDQIKDLDIETISPGWVAAIGPVDVARKLLAKLLVVFGIGEFLDVFWEVLNGGWGNIVTELGEAIARKDWPAVRRLLKKLLDIIISSEFFERLAARIGRKKAAKLVGKILARFIPFVGWAVLIAQLLWAIIEEFN